MRRSAWDWILLTDPLNPPLDPLLITLPDPLGKALKDPNFPGRNAMRLAESIKKYERQKRRQMAADLKKLRG